MRLSYFRNELLIRNRFLLKFKLEIWFTVYSYAWEVRTFNEIMRAIQRKICATAEHPTKNSIWSLYLAYVHTFNLHIRIELEKIKTCLLFYDDHRKKRRHETTPLLWDLPTYVCTYLPTGSFDRIWYMYSDLSIKQPGCLTIPNVLIYMYNVM